MCFSLFIDSRQLSACESQPNLWHPWRRRGRTFGLSRQPATARVSYYVRLTHRYWRTHFFFFFFSTNLVFFFVCFGFDQSCGVSGKFRIKVWTVVDFRNLPGLTTACLPVVVAPVFSFFFFLMNSWALIVVSLTPLEEIKRKNWVSYQSFFCVFLWQPPRDRQQTLFALHRGDRFSPKWVKASVC